MNTQSVPQRLAILKTFMETMHDEWPVEKVFSKINIPDYNAFNCYLLRMAIKKGYWQVARYMDKHCELDVHCLDDCILHYFLTLNYISHMMHHLPSLTNYSFLLYCWAKEQEDARSDARFPGKIRRKRRET